MCKQKNKKKIYSFSVNTIKIFISSNENIQNFRTRENTDVFITLDDNIYGIYSKRVNILYVSYVTRVSNWYWLTVGQDLLSL